MKRLLATTMLMGLLSAPAFAQDQTMSCAEFTALDEAGQNEALMTLQGTLENSSGVDTNTTASTGTGASAGSADTGDSDVLTVNTVLDACAANPDVAIDRAVDMSQSD